MKKIFLYLVFLFLLYFFITGCSHQNNKNNEQQAEFKFQKQINSENNNQEINYINLTEDKMQQISESYENKFTFEEISKHSSENDCWVIVNGKVYDITKYIPSHPGGRKIINSCGKDASSSFLPTHGSKAKANLENYYIGEILNSDKNN